MKCYFYKCDKNYLLLEKGHFKQVHKSWSHQLVMFLYSKFTFSPGQWPLWTAVSPLSGLISMAWHGMARSHLLITFFTAEADAKAPL